jgi:hypothetical protein
MKRPVADPNPHEILGSELAAGMQTYIRVQVPPDGEVKFKPDVYLSEQLLDTRGCNGVHFVANSEGGKKHDKLVCYWSGAHVWVKDMRARA